jgi:DNA repair exonuclease SbcCD ATPase subunit
MKALGAQVPKQTVPDQSTKQESEALKGLQVDLRSLDMKVRSLENEVQLRNETIEVDDEKYLALKKDLEGFQKSLENKANITDVCYLLDHRSNEIHEAIETLQHSQQKTSAAVI